MSYIQSLDKHEIDNLRKYLEGDFEQFSRFCFKIMTGQKLLFVDYYVVLFKAIQRMIDGECARMVINIPPRAGKTLLISTMLPLFAWCRNPSGQSILTGFNSDVLSECSGFIRAIMTDPDFQKVFPDVELDKNKKSVEKLGTMSAGVIHAIPITGKMTGKGCGALVEGFAGFMSIDDAIKPRDANSPTERDKVNRDFSNTLLSRPATEDTPIVIMMQRLHTDDLCGYLLKGGTDDDYEWLNIPGIITEETGSEKWYQDQIDRFGYTNAKPITYHLPESETRQYVEREFEGKLQKVSSFWSIRKTVDTLLGLLKKDSYTFYSQYMGAPVNKGKLALKPHYLQFYEGEFPKKKIKYTFITADTAATKETYSDYTVAMYWGLTTCNRLAMLDAVIGKWETPELIVAMRDFWKKHNVYDRLMPRLRPRGFYMEDKSSGLFLNQQFLKDGTVRVKPVPRDGTKNNDKFSRFLNTIPYFKDGLILLPKDHEHTAYITRELLGQSEYGPETGNDDVADNVSDAVAIGFVGKPMSYKDWS